MKPGADSTPKFLRTKGRSSNPLTGKRGDSWGLDEPNYWTAAERRGIDQMHIWVLQNGWESSGYAIMFRTLQEKIKNMNNNHIYGLLHREG